MFRLTLTGAMLLSSLAIPAVAQDTKKAMTPTLVQCQGGYKDSYMKSMKWSKTDFDSACRTVMDAKGTKK